MPTDIGPVDSSKSLAIDFAPQDSHVYAYRIWWREVGADWVEIGTGGTASGSTNHFEHTVVPAEQLFYVVNVGTAQGHPRPAAYTATFTFRQGGALLASGTASIAGMTNADGNATNQDWTNFT